VCVDSYQFRDYREERRGVGAGTVVMLVTTIVLLSAAIGVGLARFGSELPLIGTFIGEPEATTTTPVAVEDIQALNQLATVRWIGSVVVTQEAEPGLVQRLAESWIGVDTSGLTGESVIVTATGQVEAGVDLEQLRPEDVQVRGETVTIRLPEPQILSSSLDEERTGLYDRDRGIFVYRGDDTLVEDARREAVVEITRAAEESDILEQARRNAEESIRTFVTSLGFEEVRFVE
jgi:hypothetical protein